MMVKLNSITQWLRRGLPFIAVLLLVSCSSNTGERKVLPADEMAHVLYDYQLATSLAQEDNQGMSSSDEMINSSSDSSLAESHRNYLKYRTAVFSKYNISESDYKHSLAFYLRNPEEMKRLNTQLERIITEVNRDNSGGNRVANGAADSVMLWQKDYVLLDAATSNHFVYEGSAKGKRMRNDALVLSFDAQWLYGGGSKQAQTFVTAVYDNDSLATTYYSIYYFQTHHEVRLPLAKRNLKKVVVQFSTSSTWDSYPQVVNLSEIKLHRVKDAAQ